MPRIVALAGGVGGAKLADGLYQTLGPDELSVMVNTADDLDLFGLRVCPDVDTVTYTLAGLANPATGWGIADDTFHALEMLGYYGEDTWFRVGDRDFATHLERTARLRRDESLTDITARLASALGVRARILPMCDEPVATRVRTPEGTLDFQDYFVRRQHGDRVVGVEFVGIERASVTSAARVAIESAEAVVFCPSNPIVSIGPILAVPGLRDLLARQRVPRIAVSPIVGGQAIRGPADRMLASLGHEVSAHGVARIYAGLIDGMVIDEVDAALTGGIEAQGIAVLVAPTLMVDSSIRRDLARRVLSFARDLGQR